MSTIVEQIQTELKAFNEKKKAFVEQLRTEFPQLLLPLFEQYPEVDNISWNQYTPYFNDGDECVFRVYNDYIDVNDLSAYSVEDRSIRDAFVDVLQTIPDDFYRELFDDHVTVTVFRDGRIEVTECKHD